MQEQSCLTIRQAVEHVRRIGDAVVAQDETDRYSVYLYETTMQTTFAEGP